MLLIHPPIVKPCEPPAGIAKLSGALNSHDIPHKVLDANIEGLLFLLNQPRAASDTWTRRAIKNISSNIVALRAIETYQSFDRYSRAVSDIRRVLAVSGGENGAILGLADFQHPNLSPVRSTDLLCAAEHPEQNPFYPYFKERLPQIIQEASPPQGQKAGFEAAVVSEDQKKRTQPIIGISLNYLSQALCSFAMIGYIKKAFPGMTIILGGGLVSSWMRQPDWKNPFMGLVDHLIKGPGELPLLDLIGVTEKKRNYYTPDYTQLPHDLYMSPGFILPYSAATGCYWNKCSFCPEATEDSSYIPAPAGHVIRDFSALIKKTGPSLIHLLDNAINPTLLRAMIDNPPGAPWYGFVRIENDLLDLDYCMQLKQAGCVMLKIGLESGDQKVLNNMQKGIDLSDASQVLKNLHAAGIATYVYLLFGTPYETETEARRTLDFVVKHGNEISFLNLAIFNMPRCGCDVGEFETGQFYEGDLSLYTGFKHPRGWDRKLVRRFLNHEFKRHPVIASRLKNDPPFFTSNHAALFIQQTT
jgi:hypothetical protein